jgi:phosphatidylinositol alpha-mannosyltransferase
VRIGVVTHAYYPRYGGVSEHVAALAREMRARGHHVTIITGHFAGEDPSEPDVVRVSRTYLVPHNGAFCDLTLGPLLPFRLRTALRRGNFDVVHVHEPYAPVIGLLAVRLAPCPVVGTFHATAPSNRGYALFARALRAYSRPLVARIAVSSPARAFVHRYVPAHYEIIPNGVDTDRFSPAVSPLPAYDKRPVVLFVGRLDPRKGAAVLVDAMAIVRRDFSDAFLLVVGDGPLRERIRRRAAALLGDAARFVGAVERDELPRYYAAADVVVSPALGNESFGIVLLEAMASGRPVVASDIAGYRSVLTHGRDGLLVPPNDPSNLARALVHLLAEPELRMRLSTEGRRTACRYDWRVVADRVEALYIQAAGLSERPGRRAGETPPAPIPAQL